MSRPKRGSDSRLRGQASTSAQSNNSISINEVDRAALCTRSDVLLSISPNSNELVELVAIVYKIQGPWMSKDRNGKIKHVLAFVVHNDNGDRVQLTIWDQLINKFISKIHCQHRIHIAGATPREVDNKYNDGTVPYELLVQSNTTIEDMGRTSIIYKEEKNKVPSLTSSAVLRSLPPNLYELPEIVAIVHEIKKRESFKDSDGKTRHILKFIVHNTNDLVQLAIRDDLIDKFISNIHPQQIIRIERLRVDRNSNPNFNAGTVDYQLAFQKSTIIEDMGTTRIIYSENLNDLELVPLISIHKHRNLIRIHGFVKLNWRIVDRTQDEKKDCSGSLVDDGHHVGIKISEFDPDFESPFQRGEHIECIGKVLQTDNSLCFSVKSIDYIKKIDDEMAQPEELLNSMPLPPIPHYPKRFRSS